MAEHLIHTRGTRVMGILSVMFTLCLRFGVVPSSFGQGLLIPLLKNCTLDPSVQQNYRPITISQMLSKVLELYIIDMIGQFDYSDLQFSFVQGRSTQMVSVLTNDVISYCTSRGSTIYTCSLDAEGAFDSIPHPVLFRKWLGAVPDHWCIGMIVCQFRSNGAIV